MRIETQPLTATVGAEVHGIGAEQLAKHPMLAPAVVDALEAHGVLIFRALYPSPEQQVAFCRNIGEVDCSSTNHEVPGIFRVSLDRTKSHAAAYLLGTFEWHVDGCTPDGDAYPQMATVLSAKAVAEAGGETEFASSYAAYDDL